MNYFYIMQIMNEPSFMKIICANITMLGIPSGITHYQIKLSPSWTQWKDLILGWIKSLFSPFISF